MPSPRHRLPNRRLCRVNPLDPWLEEEEDVPREKILAPWLPGLGLLPRHRRLLRQHRRNPPWKPKERRLVLRQDTYPTLPPRRQPPTPLPTNPATFPPRPPLWPHKHANNTWQNSNNNNSSNNSNPNCSNNNNNPCPATRQNRANAAPPSNSSSWVPCPTRPRLSHCTGKGGWLLFQEHRTFHRWWAKKSAIWCRRWIRILPSIRRRRNKCCIWQTTFWTG